MNSAIHSTHTHSHGTQEHFGKEKGAVDYNAAVKPALSPALLSYSFLFITSCAELLKKTVKVLRVTEHAKPLKKKC